MNKGIEESKDSVTASIESLLLNTEGKISWETTRYRCQIRNGNGYKSSRCISMIAEDNYDEESNPF